VPPLTRDELAPLIAQIDAAWDVRDVADERRGSVTVLARDYAFKDFKEAMRFAARIGELAEEQQHHPDLHVAWGRVGVVVWTHKIGGLTESDVVFAAKCDVAYSPAPLPPKEQRFKVQASERPGNQDSGAGSRR
jgi:4a-hydroxytetrahydrobiopterin dehydratase